MMGRDRIPTTKSYSFFIPKKYIIYNIQLVLVHNTKNKKQSTQLEYLPKRAFPIFILKTNQTSTNYHLLFNIDLRTQCLSMSTSVFNNMPNSKTPKTRTNIHTFSEFTLFKEKWEFSFPLLCKPLRKIFRLHIHYAYTKLCIICVCTRIRSMYLTMQII